MVVAGSDEKDKSMKYLLRSRLRTGTESLLLYLSKQATVQIKFKGWRNRFRLSVGKTAKLHGEGTWIQEGG